MRHACSRVRGGVAPAGLGWAEIEGRVACGWNARTHTILARRRAHSRYVMTPFTIQRPTMTHTHPTMPRPSAPVPVTGSKRRGCCPLLRRRDFRVMSSCFPTANDLGANSYPKSPLANGARVNAFHIKITMPDRTFPIVFSDLILSLIFLTVALAFVCVVALTSAAFGPSDFKSFNVALGSRHKASRHHSTSKHSTSKHSGKSHSSDHSSHLGGVTSKCQNVPADNAAGTFQFVDKKCGSGAMGSVPGCMGDKHNCRFCQTSIVPKHSRNIGWPTCPSEVCDEMKALGCRGESTTSKTEVLWQLAREKAIAHNELVTGISIGKCATTAADQKLGRHQFSDESCTHGDLGAGCLGRGSSCRFCQLSTAKHQVDWPTCPNVVCQKWKVKGGGCEKPLSKVTVPPEHPPKDFDVNGAIEAEQKKMKKVIYDQAHPAEVKGGTASHGDGLMKKTKRTGNIIVDLLQSKDRGKHGLDEHLKGGRSTAHH